jgi:hypothetical protein
MTCHKANSSRIQTAKVEIEFLNPDGNWEKKKYSWYGSDNGGWYVVFGDDIGNNSQFDRAYYANWELMQAAVNDWLDDFGDEED